jgi:hypothetical protein
LRCELIRDVRVIRGLLLFGADSEKEAKMWKILKAEISYDKFKILFFYGFCIACLVTIWFGVKWERNIAPMTMLIMLISLLAIVYSGEIKRIAQKRDCLHVALPIPLRQIGLAHLMFPFLIWISIVLMFFLSYLIVRPYDTVWPTNPNILQLLTLNGLVISVCAVALLSRDLRKVFIKKPARLAILLFWILIYIAALLPFYIVTNSFGLFGENTPLQILLVNLSVSPVPFNIVGIVLSFISLEIFMRRKSYVGS